MGGNITPKQIIVFQKAGVPPKVIMPTNPGTVSGIECIPGTKQGWIRKILR